MKTIGFLVLAIVLGRRLTPALVSLRGALVGFRTNVAALGQPALFALALALSVAAVAGRLSCALGSTTLRFRQVPLLDERGYTALVAVVIVTTLVTPLRGRR